MAAKSQTFLEENPKRFPGQSIESRSTGSPRRTQPEALISSEPRRLIGDEYASVSNQALEIYSTAVDAEFQQPSGSRNRETTSRIAAESATATSDEPVDSRANNPRSKATSTASSTETNPEPMQSELYQLGLRLLDRTKVQSANFLSEMAANVKEAAESCPEPQTVTPILERAASELDALGGELYAQSTDSIIAAGKRLLRSQPELVWGGLFLLGVGVTRQLQRSATEGIRNESTSAKADSMRNPDSPRGAQRFSRYSNGN